MPKHFSWVFLKKFIFIRSRTARA